MKDADPAAELNGLAVAYCEGLHNADGALFERLCDDRFIMTGATGAGGTTSLDKAGFVARVGGRDPFPGAPAYTIHGIDVAGGEIGRVHLSVEVPPRRYEDHLGFIRDGGEWKLITKLYRVESGPALDA